MRCLNDMYIDEICYIDKVLTKGSIRQRFLDIGLIENTKVKCVLKSPSGDPKAFLIRDAVIAIRNDDCKDVFIKSHRKKA